LLARLVEPFVASADSACYPTHRGARGSSFAGVAGYRTANYSERRTTSSTF
jgi:hypothetical protein